MAHLYRSNHICSIIQQKLANQYRLLNTYAPYYKYKAEQVLEDDFFSIYYDRPIITEPKVSNNWPDIVVLNETNSKVLEIDGACPKK